VVCSDALLRDVVSSTLLRRHLNFDFLHSSIASALNRQLLTSLGVETLTVQHLLEIGKSIVAQLRPDEGKWPFDVVYVIW